MRTTLLTLLLAATTPSVWAQTGVRLTEEATTSAAGTLVLEGRANVIADEPNFLTGEPRARWDAPILRFVYSPADNVGLDFEWVGRVVAVNDPSFGTVSDWGDVTLRAKLRLLEPRARRPALGARFYVSLPETSAEVGLGPNTLRMAAEALISQPVGHGLLHANAGMLIHDRLGPEAAQSDFLSYGLALHWPAGHGADIVAEIAGRAGTGTPGADQRSELRLGVQVPAGHLRWDLGLRRGLVEHHGTWGVTAGVTLTGNVH